MPFTLNCPYPLAYPLTRLARRIHPPHPTAAEESQEGFVVDYQYPSTRQTHQAYMKDLVFEGSTVLDVGSGLGGRAPYWLEQGACRVVCIDINRQELAAGRSILAQRFPALRDRVDFLHPDDIHDRACGDVAILYDTFEHLVDPPALLRQCYDWLRPGGVVWIGSIGWYHYRASHCMPWIPIPWCQVLFSERALIHTVQAILHDPAYEPNVWDRLLGRDRWDRVKTLKDRPGEALNMLSLRKIRRILRASPFQLRKFEVHPFSGRIHPVAKAARLLATVPGVNELFHSYYTATLTKPDAPRSAP